MLAVILVVTAQANCGAVDDVLGNIRLQMKPCSTITTTQILFLISIQITQIQKNEDVSNGQYPP